MTGGHRTRDLTERWQDVFDGCLVQTSELMQFGDCELDARSGELRRGEDRVVLQEQPLRVLLALLEHPGQVVTREELRHRLWPDDTFVDYERGLNAAVNRLRETLHDSANTPHLIETLPRRGYRFIGPAQADGHPPASPSTPEESGGGAVALPRRRVWPAWRGTAAAVTAVSVVVAVIALSAWLLRPRATGVGAPRVVVLTTLDGYESAPALSPDGQTVAFSWDGESHDNHDVYLTLVGSQVLRRLTTDPADDGAPTWSPDGRQLAFVRCSRALGGCRIFLTSPLGGPERRLSDFPVSGRPSWSPDG